MIELSKNYVALNMAKFIYEEESKQEAKKQQQHADIKAYFFNLYGECLKTVEKNDPTSKDYSSK